MKFQWTPMWQTINIVEIVLKLSLKFTKVGPQCLLCYTFVMAQFSLSNVHKRALIHHHFISVLCVCSKPATNYRMHFSLKFKLSSLLLLRSRKLAFPVLTLRRRCTFCFLEQLLQRISFCTAGGFIDTEEALHLTVHLMDITKTSADMASAPTPCSCISGMCR